MADQEKMQPAKRPSGENAERDMAGQGHTGGDLQKEHQGSPPGGTVGRTVPDHSKERNTEIAVEAGRSGRTQRDDKR
jgi:hypothetical protein